MKEAVFFLVVVILLMMGRIMIAGPVTPEQAQQVAVAWYQHICRSVFPDKTIVQVYPEKYNGMVTFYTFAFKAGGFVMVAADDASIPILGYSDEGHFPEEISCPATRQWLDDYSAQLALIMEEGISNATTRPVWDAILAENFPPPGRDVDPLLTTKWSQGCYYNELCPADPAGQCGHAATGCVATAMAQLMKYHNFPPRGVGEHCYPHPTYGMLCADFGNTTYDWASMPDFITSSNLAVATIMCHAGVSVNMIYGPNGSGAYAEPIPEAFAEYFNYDPRLELHKMIDYQNPEEWKDLLRANLDQLLPVYYLGANPADGHAFICDGYRMSDEMFHFNWGWGGYADGYFAIGLLNTPYGNWNLNNMAITGIRPFNPDLVVRIISPANNFVFKAGEEITIEAATVYGTPDLMQLTIDGEMVASGTSAELTYNWQTTIADTASHEVIAWSYQGDDTVWYEINLNVAESWISQESGFQRPLQGVISISAVDSNVVWAVPRDGVWEWGTPDQEFTRTTDGGEHWNAGLINNCEGMGAGMIFAISELKAYVPMFRYNGPNPQGIYVTTDGGATWNRQTSAAFSHAYAFPDVLHFFNENEGWCLGDPVPQGGALEFEIYTTTDGGENWILVPAENKPNPISQEYAILSYSAVNDTLWFGTTQGRVYKSTDKGYNWTVSPVPDMAGEWLTPVFRNGSHGLVNNFFNSEQVMFTVGAICETFDGGQNWTKINQEGPLYWTDLAYIPETENTWISTGGRIPYDCGASVSHDGGHTWADIPGTNGTKFRYMKWLNENLGWAGGYNSNDTIGGMFKFEKDVSVSIVETGSGSTLSVFPNPARGIVDCQFGIANFQWVTLKIYDAHGREVMNVLDRNLPAGEHSVRFDLPAFPAGLYLLRLQSGDETLTQKLIHHR